MSEIGHPPFPLTVAWQLAGGDTIERHCHDDHQLVYVSAGVLEARTEEGSWVVSRDRALWLPAGVWHQHRFYGASSFHTVGFPTREPPGPGIDPTLVSVSPLLRELIIACADPALTEDEARRIRAVIGDQLKRSRQRPMTLPAPSDPRLIQACAVVSERLEQQITLAALAHEVGASESTLSRLFRHDLGMTYPRWRTNLRLLRAAILLSSGTPVTQTAHQCGWQTASSFIDTFRRAMGQTPGSYRTSAPQPISTAG